VKIPIVVLALWLTLLGASPAEARRRYAVKVESEPPGASIYLGMANGPSLGLTPHTLKLARGDHTLLFKLDGYLPLTREVTVQGETTVKVVLKATSRPAVLAIEAGAGGVSAGADVLINGKKVGVLPVQVNLGQGRYLVEVAKEGYREWRKWVDTTLGERLTLEVVLEPEAAATGTLMVTSNAPGARVSVDGKEMGVAPVLAPKLAPGAHRVEVAADGYHPDSVTVRVQGGVALKVVVALEPTEAALASKAGTMQVITEPAGAEVLVDGMSQGPAPVKVVGLASGVHLAEAREEGYQDAEARAEVKAGEVVTVKLTLKEKVIAPRTGSIRVESAVKGARVFVDGKEVGSAPRTVQGVLAGPHMVKVTARGYDEAFETVVVKAGEESVLKAKLTRQVAPSPGLRPAPRPLVFKPQKGPMDAKKALDLARKDTYPVTTFGAQGIGPGYFTADLSLGFPYILGLRLSAGIWEGGNFAVDTGVLFRTFGDQSEIGLHAKVRLLKIDPFAVGTFLELGGGGGPGSRSTFFFNLGAGASYWYKRYFTVTARLYLNVYSDRLCAEDPGVANQSDICRRVAPPGEPIPPDQYPELEAIKHDRLAGARFYMEAILEVPFHKYFSVWALLRGAPGASQRWALRDVFSPVMPEADPRFYGRVGVTLKF